MYTFTICHTVFFISINLILYNSIFAVAAPYFNTPDQKTLDLKLLSLEGLPSLTRAFCRTYHKDRETKSNFGTLVIDDNKSTTIWSGDGNVLVQKHEVAFVPSSLFAKSGGGETGSNNNSSVCKESNGQFADPMFCDKYYDCWEGRPVSSGQCSHGLMFNEQTASCDYPKNVNCDGKEVNQPVENLDQGCEQAYGTFADKRDCRKFTVCHAGIATHYTCEEGLAYDKDSGICLPPPDPLCLQGPPNDIPEGQDVPEVPLDPDMIKPAPPSGPSGGSGDGDSIAFPVPDWPHATKCPTSSSGFIPIVKDCKSVLVCINGSGYLLTCPLGTYYHPSVASCKPGKSDSCEQMKFHIANPKSNTVNAQKYGYFMPSYPLLPLR